MEYWMFVAVCLAIHAVVNIDIFRRKPTVSLPAIRAYRVFVLSVVIYFLADLLWGIFEMNKLAIPLYVDTTFYFLIMGFTILAWARYTVKFLQVKGVAEKIILYTGNIFFLTEVVLLIVNIFTPVLFRVDLDTCVYQTYKARNIMLYVQFLVYVLLAIYTLVYTLRSKGSFRRRYVTIFFYSIVMGLMIAVQVYYPYLPLYSIGCVVGSTSLNSFVISDIKEEYKIALESSRAEIQHSQEVLSETRLIAYSDPLTGVKNKHAYVEEEERIDKLIAKNEMDEFAVVVFDLNGLKHINDTLGHDAGDVYIVDSCRTIERFFGRESLYRFGGDEFVVILEGEAFLSRSKNLTEFERFINDCLDTDKPIISSGMSKYRKGIDNTYHAVFNRADKIMYARKDALKEHKNN